MTELSDIVKNEGITFHSKGRQLDARLQDYGEYDWNLVRYLISQADSYMLVRGDRLEEFLRTPRNLNLMTNFLVQLLSAGHDMSFHVDTDIERIATSYPKQPEDAIVNLLGQRIATMSWLSDKTEFERMWNFSLCEAIGGWIGYPGYEWPLNAEAFEEESANHATMFMIGTQQQLQRYKTWANKYPDFAKQINENLARFGQTLN
ncbi:hypothetical protein HZB03_03630 [Candidatus Woesearchaeota archaeon]|nr:hypothetical protein [Candidatus Woesearchaeota archaeon]